MRWTCYNSCYQFKSKLKSSDPFSLDNISFLVLMYFDYNDHMVVQVLEEDVASPAELAKAYMGSRPSEASPSVLGLRSQKLKDSSNLLKILPFPPKSPVMALVSKPIVRVVRDGVPENGFMTPRTRGRSAIYHMAHTPYSRVAQKVYLLANVLCRIFFPPSGC